MKETDEAREFEHMLLDKATIYSGLEGSLFKGFEQALKVRFPQNHEAQLRRSLLAALKVSHHRQSFILTDTIAIPHLPWGAVLGSPPGGPAKFGWFRSVSGLQDGETSHRSIRIVFLGVAAERHLKHFIAFACRILRDDIFLQDFQRAANGRALRQAVVDAFHRQIARTKVDHAAILQDRAKAVLHSYYQMNQNGNSEISEEIYIDHLLIRNMRGLHARAAAKLVQTVEQYACDVVLLSFNGETVSGTSIMGLMMLDVTVGHIIELVVQGRQARQLGAALSELFESAFNEEL